MCSPTARLLPGLQGRLPRRGVQRPGRPGSRRPGKCPPPSGSGWGGREELSPGPSELGAGSPGSGAVGARPSCPFQSQAPLGWSCRRRCGGASVRPWGTWNRHSGPGASGEERRCSVTASTSEKSIPSPYFIFSQKCPCLEPSGGMHSMDEMTGVLREQCGDPATLCSVSTRLFRTLFTEPRSPVCCFRLRETQAHSLFIYEL